MASPTGVEAGDVLLGLGSNGVHSNGYSLVRRLVEHTGLAWDDEAPFEQGKSVSNPSLRQLGFM